MEDRQAEGLALCMGSQIRLKAERVYRWHERFDDVQRGPWHWSVLRHVTSEPTQQRPISDQVHSEFFELTVTVTQIANNWKEMNELTVT